MTRPGGPGEEERRDDHQRAQRATHLMRWRIGLGEDRRLGGSQVESVRAVASSPPTHPCYSLPFRATDPNWVWSSDWQAGQTFFTPIQKRSLAFEDQ